jgi:hypothetical protein
MRAIFVCPTSPVGSPGISNASALPNLLLPGQYYGHDNDGYADPQLECVLET